MREQETMSGFVKENIRVAREWADAKGELVRLLVIRAIAKSAGYLVLSILALFIVFLLFIFSGITLGYWLSAVTGSYTAGFGIVTASGFLILLPLIGLFRKVFINRVIQSLIEHASKDTGDEKSQNHEEAS